jgi:hypothetical protein
MHTIALLSAMKSSIIFVHTDNRVCKQSAFSPLGRFHRVDITALGRPAARTREVEPYWHAPRARLPILFHLTQAAGSTGWGEERL